MTDDRELYGVPRDKLVSAEESRRSIMGTAYRHQRHGTVEVRQIATPGYFASHPPRFCLTHTECERYERDHRWTRSVPEGFYSDRNPR